MFSNLNSRFAAMMDNLSFIPIYLGYHGSSLGITKFYYTHLLQSNIANCLITLCVSDTFIIDNGLWLASHISTFISLRHLSLIDIKRSFFESMLNALSPRNSLIIFNVDFSSFSSDNRAAYTFEDIPEGAYYEKIFHLFPSLRECRLLFWQKKSPALDCEFVLPSDKVYIPVQSNLFNLRSLTLYCSPSFLSHLFEHLPQLQQLNYTQTNPQLPDIHPLHGNSNTCFSQITRINQSRAPNLSCLTIKWSTCMNTKSLNELFEGDVLFSLMKFRLEAPIDGPQVVQDVQSMLSSQCLYSYEVRWSVETTVSRSAISKILHDTFQQLKGPVPFELELSLKYGMSILITASTLPRRDKFLCVDDYLDENIVHRRNPSSLNKSLTNHQLVHCKKIEISEFFHRWNEEFLSYSPPLVIWQRITSLSISEPCNRQHLYLLFSQAINLRILNLHYPLGFVRSSFLEQETSLDLLSDDTLCNMLMTNGLRQLNFFNEFTPSDSVDAAHSIIKRLPHLKIIELHDNYCQIFEAGQILMNGLSKLSCLTLISCWRHGEIHERKLHDLQTSITRRFRTQVPYTEYGSRVCVWFE